MERRYAGCEKLSNERLHELEYLRNLPGEEGEERELFQIPPLVKREDQAFIVKYESISKFIAQFRIRNYLLVTTPGVYKAALNQLSNNDYIVAYVKTSKVEDLDNLDKIVEETTMALREDRGLNKEQKRINDNKYPASFNFEGVLCMGGGVAMDAGKYLAAKIGAPLYAVPTALSVNAAFCYKAAVREADPYSEGKYNVVYRFYGLPQAICIDLDIITGSKQISVVKNKNAKDSDKQAARIQWNMLRELNIAGAGDLLSMLTATFDWKINSLVARGLKVDGSESHGMVSLEKPFSQEVCDGANKVLDLLEEHATEIRAGKREGAEFLARAYHWVAEQSWIMQHTMWESASEHGMFDCFENVAGTELTHGQVVALSVFFMSLLQNNQHERSIKIIQDLGLDISLAYLCADDSMNPTIQPETLCRCLIKLKEYIEQIDYRYTIISAKPITSEWIISSLNQYYEVIYTDLIKKYDNRKQLYPEVGSPYEEVKAEDMAMVAERMRLEIINTKLREDLKKHVSAYKVCMIKVNEAEKIRQGVAETIKKGGSIGNTPRSIKSYIRDFYDEALHYYLGRLEYLNNHPDDIDDIL